MQTLTIFTLHLSVKPERRRDLIDIFTALLEPTRIQPGCLGCHLHTDYDDQNSLTLIGDWSSQAELECYLDSLIPRPLGRAPYRWGFQSGEGTAPQRQLAPLVDGAPRVIHGAR